MSNLINGFWSSIPRETEFWSAIVGAIVGGLIALFVQLIALRAAKKQRAEDQKETRRALGNSLLFKMVRIHSNIYGIHRHIEERFEEAMQRGLGGEPWQFFLPLANPPEPVNFSSEEMGMLLAQKNDDVFNLVLPMDVIHNSMIVLVKLINQERQKLSSLLKPDEVDGHVITGHLSKEQVLMFRPRMIEVNTLIESTRVNANRGTRDSREALKRLNSLLREKLGLSYKLEIKGDI